jgi:hypothetical protein
MQQQSSRQHHIWFQDKNIYMFCYKFDISVPPKMLDYSPQSFHQPLGSNVTIFCRAEGSPKPSVSWTKDGRPVRLSSRVSLNKDSSEVLIRNLQESDGGIYKCTFQNTVGLIAQTIHLIVEGSLSVVLSVYVCFFFCYCL